MGGTGMSDNYKTIIEELATKRTMSKRLEEQNIREQKNAQAEVERAVMAPISDVLCSLQDEKGRSAGLNNKIYLFDRTSNGDFEHHGQICWEIVTRDIYAAFTDTVKVTVHRYPTGRKGIRVAVYGKDGNRTVLPFPNAFMTYEKPTDAIPDIMSKIADMIRHR